MDAAEQSLRQATWEHFPHGADVGIRGFGRSAAEAFEQAACAVTTAGTHAEIRPATAVAVQCRAPDLEIPFVEWQNAIIYEMAIRGMLFGRFAVSIEELRLEGRGDISADRDGPLRHTPLVLSLRLNAAVSTVF